MLDQITNGFLTGVMIMFAMICPLAFLIAVKYVSVKLQSTTKNQLAQAQALMAKLQQMNPNIKGFTKYPPKEEGK